MTVEELSQQTHTLRVRTSCIIPEKLSLRGSRTQIGEMSVSVRGGGGLLLRFVVRSLGHI